MTAKKPQRGQDLFDQRGERLQVERAPLAARMRPNSLEEIMGQEHLLGPGKPLERAIRADVVPSMVLWGPPGTGKTTLAMVIARMTRAHFIALSAVTAGVADLRAAVAGARERLAEQAQRTILFVDEVHRFNKAQQDVILPHVENGIVIFIGATTENPSFEVNAPLLSRSRVFTLKPLTDPHVSVLLDRALADNERGLGALRAALDDDARALLLSAASGDARLALNAVELAAQVAQPGADGLRRIPRALMEDVLQRRALVYDRAGDSHYDTVSAFIKSIRASDPDAAVYWLARMVEAGEDPMFIARRVVISAAEDIGMADPMALTVAVAAQQAVHFVGMPEGAIPLAQATVYLATAAKSNSAYMALSRARDEVRTGAQHPVPLHLRNAVTGLMREMGYGREYRYAHDFPEHFAGQRNLPSEIAGKRFYEPTDQGYEAQAKARIEAWWRETQRQKPQGT